MKRHCGLGLFLFVGAVCLTAWTGCAQTDAAQIPRPVSQVTVTPVKSLDEILKFDAEDKMVTVTNGTENQVSYSLTDTPGFAAGMTITSASVVHQRTAADGSSVGSTTSVSGWTGVAPHDSLADGVTLPAGNTDIYYVTIGAVIDENVNTTVLACSPAGAGHGFFNAAAMTSGNDVTQVSACAAGAAHGVGGVTTTKPAPPSHGASPQPPLATTGSNVWLVGAVGLLLVAVGGLLVVSGVRRRHH